MATTGVSTPVSTTSTLSIPSSPPTKFAPLSPFEKGIKQPSHPASTIVEYISSRTAHSSTVFVYDLAEQAGFGALTKEWSRSTPDAVAPTISLQTRDGAGLSLAGRLSQGTSKDAAKTSVLTAYTTPVGLAAMAQSLTYLPTASANGRLVLQIPGVTPVGEAFAFTPSLASLAPALSVLQDKLAVILSATPQETVELTTLAYQVPDKHVAHIFDQHSSAREIGHIVASVPSGPVPSLSLDAALADAGYNYFDYAGDNDAHTVVVLLNGPLALAAKAFATRVQGLGVVSVRVLRPWNEDALRAVLPASVKRVHVVDDVPTATTQGPLFVDVLSALLDPVGVAPMVKEHRVIPTRTAEYTSRPQAFFDFLHGLLPGAPAPTAVLDAPASKKLLFFGIPGTPLSAVPHIIEDSFFSSPSVRARLLTDVDVFSRSGGVIATRLLLSSKNVVDEHVPAPVALPIYEGSSGEADFVAVLDPALLKTHSLLEHARPGAAVLVITPWSAAEFLSNLPHEVRALARERQLRVYTLDAAGIASSVGASKITLEAVEAALVHLAFLRLYLAGAATEAIVRAVAKRTFDDHLGEVDLAIANAHVWAGLAQIEITAEETDGELKPTLLKHFQFNAVAVETDGGDTVVNGARLTSWHDAAKYLLFSSAFTPALPTAEGPYAQNPALHPEIADRTFLITTTVNRRLTPLEYDRNVFHLEFDTSGTGLKYEIGEALGVHGWNDEQEVLEFCAWYGVDPNRLITLPVPGHEDRFHTRTVFQALQQQVDLFGRPGKAFYTALAEYASRPVDRYALLFIGAPEGSSTFKKLGETETVSFADVLMRYPSARPGIEVLCQLIGDIKPRHYSIASAQAVVGDRVDLLVVAVDWVTPSGSPRYGQCTRYLANLRVGQKVTVSIKPSVMKLPPDNMQPLILAGLGTGAAPFRAFLQYRAWLAAQSIPVGPVYYYFGSRHQSQEYLYGEEIEAFILDGTITRAGLAFSRDGKRKVYIQHKMAEDGEDLARMLDGEQGVFYLCGPTWPVSDIYEALVGALVKFRGKVREEAAVYLEELKEEERYVLEVY